MPRKRKEPEPGTIAWAKKNGWDYCKKCNLIIISKRDMLTCNTYPPPCPLGFPSDNEVRKLIHDAKNPSA